MTVCDCAKCDCVHAYQLSCKEILLEQVTLVNEPILADCMCVCVCVCVCGGGATDNVCIVVQCFLIQFK